MLAERSRRSSAEEDASALRWRDATMEERGAALAELLDFADAIVAARGAPPERQPLKVVRFDGRRKN